MNENYLQKQFLIEIDPSSVYKAIKNVKGWWSVWVEGASEKPGDTFEYRHKDMHYSRQHVVELIPDQKIVWEVLESHLGFLDNPSEWKGTRICFELQQEGDKTKLLFTHIGLTRESECFDSCTKGWDHYLVGSLLPLITDGRGNPDTAKPTLIDTKTNQI